MTSPKVYLEEQIALRESLAKQVELMENHLADPQRSPSFGIHSAGESVRVKQQIADVDARVERLRSGNA